MKLRKWRHGVGRVFACTPEDEGARTFIEPNPDRAVADDKVEIEALRRSRRWRRPRV
jgi:hypothetical protein